MKRDSGQQHLAAHAVRELALRFRSAAEDGEAQARMIGVLSLPDAPGPRGVLIVTGGPQYRIGSHRQFVLLARALAAQGWPVLRFDLRGMGDSEGRARDYRAAGPDIAGALAQFFDAVPSLREVALWGLCDGATAAACHAPRDARIAALVLLNPWVRSSAGLARATLRHYYLPRLLQGAFWRKLAGGGLRLGASLASLRQVAAATQTPATQEDDAPAPALLRALAQFQGKVLLILSGDDLGAREWQALLDGDTAWRAVAARAQWTQAQVAGANHTFASAAWRGEVEQLCARWLRSW
ncbi:MULTISPECIES: hydrolase 1, exosortase A system-associated [unclassified Janthinobacterium]|uniref:hydrolase 1, exosortase A system-associated n=1 Tax=unclassified Janthinobacterium TaxID=2610881 RepID=UPI001E3A57B1|nr:MULTISPECIES: hydrolase 1, exosortase A system-associated [unclassified Janthinobacterium]MCC7641845.1 hydrolase 1, exosortase A system-associated [Janthinobacterium sp. EB271-G4-3-1]MCC7689971.1 hydrolase 1, exosortase A system-associated [Janthinobacterium sp. EB271-G4-3-2]